MAHFYGSIKGSRSRVMRLGRKESGMETVALSWQGAVRVFLFHDDATGQDMARVTMEPWNGAGRYHLLYHGPVGKFGPEAPLPGMTVDEIAAALSGGAE